MAVVAIDTPRVQNSLIVNKFMARTTDVINNLFAPSFNERLPNPCGQVVEDFVPGNPLPFALTTFADTFKRVENTLRIIDLIDRCRSFSTIASPASWVIGIPLEAFYAPGLFIHIREQAAGSFTVEADGRNE